MKNLFNTLSTTFVLFIEKRLVYEVGKVGGSETTEVSNQGEFRSGGEVGQSNNELVRDAETKSNDLFRMQKSLQIVDSKNPDVVLQELDPENPLEDQEAVLQELDPENPLEDPEAVQQVVDLEEPPSIIRMTATKENPLADVVPRAIDPENPEK